MTQQDATPQAADTASAQRSAPVLWTEEQIRDQARADVAGWHATRHPRGHGGLPARVLAARSALDALVRRLDALPEPDYTSTAGDPVLVLRENPRLLRSALNEVAGGKLAFEKLPRLEAAADGSRKDAENGQGMPRIAAVAAGYFKATGNAWDAQAFPLYIDEIQKREPLELLELWSLSSLMKFHVMEQAVSEGTAVLDAGVPAGLNPVIQTCLKSLRDLGYADWSIVAEPLIAFDRVLREDPAGAYPRMDFESRERYRTRVAQLAGHADLTEIEVAREALRFAKLAQARTMRDPRVYVRESHIGYYLVDTGADDLAHAIGYRPPFLERIRMAARRDADLFYIAPIEILSVLLIAGLVLPIVPITHNFGGLVLAFLLLVLPVTQGVVDLVNNIVTAIFEARGLPKLNFKKFGIPEDCTTLVAVPTLLGSEAQLRELIADLEVRYLANQDPNLHFALITDLPDAVTRPRENDSDPLVDLAVKLINGLNARYCGHSKGGCFVLFHRLRIFNARQGVWMGWERKRGKLLDLNKYLEGVFDAFPVKAGPVESVRKVRYIITLDSDTQLPRGTAATMVGAMAHPLNCAVIDPERRIVTAGYGILQPRVGVSVQSASRSRLAALFSGQTGFDIYTRAVSDVYQDLYGEGIFTGKGIYEVATLHAVLDRRFPRNSLLSHDLIEGAYARAGLATDIEVVDDYPSHYSAYTRRKHRWVRGDWQIAQWLFKSVPDESRKTVRNPISTISRWKILDNLRRSLVEPFTMLLLIAGWLGLDGGALYWTLITLLLMFLPTIVQLIFSVGRASVSDTVGSVGEAIRGGAQGAFITFLNVVFLPHSTFLSLDAIGRALVRRFITGQRLLEWETAADAEAGKRVTPVDRYLTASPLFALAVALLIYWRHAQLVTLFASHGRVFTAPFALLVALPVLLLWALASLITAWLNSPVREETAALGEKDAAWLREHALRIWRYFLEFGGRQHNFLIPDNVEEAGLFEAPRVSPTNLGLLLNARQAAVEFGWLTVPEFAELTLATLGTFETLEKHRGHLYNWYNTQTLEPMLPITVSSVDSGNFAASLYTLRMGAAELLERPVIEPRLITGLHSQSTLAQTDAPGVDATVDTMLRWTLERAAALAEPVPAVKAETQPAAPNEAAWWKLEYAQRLRAIAALATKYQPWLLPRFAPLRSVAPLGLGEHAAHPRLAAAEGFAQQLAERLQQFRTAREPDGDAALLVLAEQLQELLPAAAHHLHTLAAAVTRCSEQSFRLANDMDFAFLINRDRQMLSIGYDVPKQELHSACYDMLASEARVAVFVAVGKGDLEQESWFKMGRTHTLAFGHAVLLSWTGTMFEYLMPSLWMRSYPETLMARTLAGVVQVQRNFGRKQGIPWGISESGYAETDDAGHYHYRAFGIPQIALKWDATAGPVVAPYASFLALGMDREHALRNLRAMTKAGWSGDYGLYEGIDYVQGKDRPRLVREWMAHHQGMALMALLNLLHQDACQRWFHANPHLQAAELLLHEKPIREAALRAEVKDQATRKTASQAG